MIYRYPNLILCRCQNMVDILHRLLNIFLTVHNLFQVFIGLCRRNTINYNLFIFNFRCNVGVMLLCDVVVDGIELDWTIHVPLMLHILFLGLDHTRPLVYQHCKQLLLNLLIVLAQHNDHLTVAHLLLNSKTNQLELGLTTPTLPVLKHNFTG